MVYCSIATATVLEDCSRKDIAIVSLWTSKPSIGNRPGITKYTVEPLYWFIEVCIALSQGWICTKREHILGFIEYWKISRDCWPVFARV